MATAEKNVAHTRRKTAPKSQPFTVSMSDDVSAPALYLSTDTRQSARKS